ncbi:MAG: site-specific integrase [Deltaproteobacteria bacterium]|nr:site-specific integrase [Deltaproteobacteria bacterium]
MGVKVRQKTKGKGNPWWVFISHDKKRTSRKVGSKKAAQEVASKIEAKLQLGEFGFEEKKKVLTFKEYADLWLRSDIPALCKKSTGENYRGFLNKHILPVFGNLKVTDINRGKVKNFLLETVGSGYSKSYADQFKNVISGVLNKAVDDEVIQANPALQLGKNFLKVKDNKDTISTITSEELKQLLDTVEKHFSGDYPLFLLLARSGLRIGEALALKWGDIDFNDRSIEVCRNFYRNRITKPKNGKTRLVDMSLQLSKTLKAHKLSCKKKGLVLGLGDLPEYVFTNKYGRLINLYEWRKQVFYKVIKKSGIKKIRIHDLRHTYATLRISKGDNVADVSKQLGHHSVKFTMDTYYHWFPGKKKSEVDGLDDPIHPAAPYVHPNIANSI